MKSSKRELVGHCNVDSGLIWIGDPCYIKDQPMLTDDSKWKDFCNVLYPKGDSITPLEICNGVVTNSGIGDGTYPVYVYKDSEGNVKKMEIVF